MPTIIIVIIITTDHPHFASMYFSTEDSHRLECEEMDGYYNPTPGDLFIRATVNVKASKFPLRQYCSK